jgi:hypothetical protein
VNRIVNQSRPAASFARLWLLLFQTHRAFYLYVLVVNVDSQLAFAFTQTARLYRFVFDGHWLISFAKRAAAIISVGVRVSKKLLNFWHLLYGPRFPVSIINLAACCVRYRQTCFLRASSYISIGTLSLSLKAKSARDATGVCSVILALSQAIGLLILASDSISCCLVMIFPYLKFFWKLCYVSADFAFRLCVYINFSKRLTGSWSATAGFEPYQPGFPVVT